MNSILKKLRKNRDPAPCLFYPAAQNETIAELLTDCEKQARLLLRISESYPVGAVIRMTELWCEAAAFGMQCRLSDHDFPGLGDPVFADAEALKGVTIPSVDNPVTKPLIDAVRLAAPHMDKPLIVGVTAPYTLGSVLNGSVDFMMNCISNPDIVHGFLQQLTSFLIEYITAYKTAGASAVILAEPSIAMISPSMTGEFSNTYIKKIINRVQDETFSVIYHNCGAVNAHLDAILELDADAFHFGSEVDMDRVLRSVHDDRLVMGNIEPRLFIGDNEDAVKSNTSALWEKYASFPNWRLSTGCDLSPNASGKSISAFFESAKGTKRN